MSEEKEAILDGVIEEIISNYADGTLIPHEWLKKKCGLTMPDFKDYGSVSDFLEAVQLQQFSYMSFIDSLRWELIEKWNMRLRHIALQRQYHKLASRAMCGRNHQTQRAT